MLRVHALLPLIRASCATVMACAMLQSCARMPYTTQVIQEDRRTFVVLQQEVNSAGYSHPVNLSPEELTSILSGFSFREKQRLPLRWFAEEAPPKQLFRPDEVQVLAQALSEALKKAGPEERVYFQVLGPGMAPAYERDTTGGWIAVREPYFHFTLEHFHAQFPTRKSEQWDLRYPAVPPEPKTYLLYFEPGRFWGADPSSGRQALQVREFLKSAVAPSQK